jgi:hypothetical protein
MTITSSFSRTFAVRLIYRGIDLLMTRKVRATQSILLPNGKVLFTTVTESATENYTASRGFSDSIGK